MGTPHLMQEIRVTLACGCSVSIGGEAPERPYCEPHDEYRVQRVTAPPPSFLARDCEAHGPYARKAD